VSRA